MVGTNKEEFLGLIIYRMSLGSTMMVVVVGRAAVTD